MVLPQYRVELLNTSKRIIPEKLIYIGNFVNAVRPQKEFVPHTKENGAAVPRDFFNKSINLSLHP